MNAQTEQDKAGQTGSQAANTAKSEAILEILSAIVDSIKAAGSAGAPGGVLYAALMAHGCSLQQFQSIMGILVQTGRVTRSGELYFAK